MTRPPNPAARSDFPPGARLHVPSEYTRAFGEGRRLHGRLFRLHVRPDPAQPARLGASVSRKVDRRAVQRNRIKRLCRETFRRLRHQLPPGDYVLVAKPGTAAQSADAIRQELQRLLAQAAALKPPAPPGTMAALESDRADRSDGTRPDEAPHSPNSRA